METKKLKKNLQRFECEFCDFKCYMKCDWDRHLTRPKHLAQSGGNTMETKKLKKNLLLEFICNNCNKEYKSRTGLWKHKKICNETTCENNMQLVLNSDNKTDIINTLLNQNIQLQQQIIDLCKENKTIINNTTNNNSINKTFNLNVFLNETCKDAMNLTDFVDSLKLQLTDLENVGKLGFVDGISNIFIKNLKALEVEKRPVHCSDTKRETLYVKEDDKWEKENDEKDRLKKAIKLVANKNINMIPEWKEKYPDCTYADSKKSDQYNHIMIQSLDYINPSNNEKIIKKIAKEVGIEKE